MIATKTSIAIFTFSLIAGFAAVAESTVPMTETFYGRNFTRSLEHFDSVGSSYDLPDFPKGRGGGTVFYPSFSDSQRHRLPVLAQTSIDDLYNAPIPSGKTPVYFVVMTLSKRSSLSSVTFAPHNGEELSDIGAPSFQRGGAYELYEYVQGQQIGSPVSVTFNPSYNAWTFTAPFASQTFQRGVPVVYEFVH